MTTMTATTIEAGDTKLFKPESDKPAIAQYSGQYVTVLEVGATSYVIRTSTGFEIVATAAELSD